MAGPTEPTAGDPLWSLIELDPATLDARYRVALPRTQHPPAVDAEGTVWVSADGVRALPAAPDSESVAVVAAPLDLEALTPTDQEPGLPDPTGTATTGIAPSRFLDVARRVGRPHELPVPVAWSAVLGRGTGLIVALVGAQVHRSGIELALTIRSRYRRNILPAGAPMSDGTRDALLIGVEFADGRATTSHAHRSPVRNLPEHEDQLVLHERGGGGDGHHVDVRYFLSPLPPPGDLTLHCLWSAFGIAETATILDTTPVLDAAAGVEVLWPPDDPGPAPETTGASPPVPRATRRAGWPHPKPEVPAGGWFDQHVNTPPPGP